jgi:hypothetical protein
MTRHLSLLAITLLTLLLLAGCAPPADRAGRSAVESRPGTGTGITVFGDARIGATF